MKRPKYEDLDLGDEVSRGVLGIWAFHGFYGEAGHQNKGRERLKDTTYILISCPTRTFLLHMPLKPDPELITEYPELDYNAEKYDPNMITVDLGLEYNARSIAAGSTPRGFIQVTENSIRAISLPLPQEQAMKVEDQEDVKPNKKFMDRWSRARYCFNFEDSRVVAACIYDLAGKTFILVAVQQAENFCLQLGHLDAGYEPAITTPLRSQPSCLLLRRVGHHLLALVGTLEKELLIYATDSDGYNFKAASRYEFQDPFAICDSLAIITSSNNDDEQLTYIVVCGLRNGSLKTLYLGADYLRELVPLFS